MSRALTLNRIANATCSNNGNGGAAGVIGDLPGCVPDARVGLFESSNKGVVVNSRRCRFGGAAGICRDGPFGSNVAFPVIDGARSKIVSTTSGIGLSRALPGRVARLDGGICAGRRVGGGFSGIPAMRGACAGTRISGTVTSTVGTLVPTNCRLIVGGGAAWCWS